jgi:hypothetical protein
MALNVAPSHQHGLNATISNRRIGVNDFTQPRHHSLAAGLDALGDCNFTFTCRRSATS